MSDVPAKRAISRIETPEARLFAFKVTDKISEDDIEWMAGVLTAAFDRLDEVDILITMPNYDGIELGAVFDSEGLAAQAKSVRHVRKYAVVGAPGWAKGMINFFGPVSPIDTKTFDLDEEAAAWDWVRAAGR